MICTVKIEKTVIEGRSSVVCEMGIAVVSFYTAFPEDIWCRLPSKPGQDLLIGVCYKTPNR